MRTFAPRAAIVVTLVWAISLLLWFTPGIARPDGAGYFVYLPSAYFDRDLLFFDEWQRVGLIRDGEIHFKSVTPTDHLGNHWTVGSATAWFPAYLLGDGLAVAMGRQRDGFALPYSVPVLVVSALAGLATLLAAVYVARDLRLRALAAALAIWFGSPLLWYSLRHGSMAHAMSAVAGAAIVVLALRLRDEITADRILAVGMAIGFAVAVRPQNAPLALLPFFLLDRQRNLRLLRGVAWLAIGGVIGVLPQIVVSQVLNGSPLAFVNVGGAAHQWQMFERVRVWEPMLSWFHGLVPWTPILVLAVAGLIPLARIDRGLALAGAWAFLSQWLMVALLDRSFWGGVSFGQRRFDNCTFFFVLGLAALFTRLPAWIAALLATLGSAWTMALVLATSRFDLNVYQPPAAILDAARQSVLDPKWYRILGSTPEAHRQALLVVIGLTLAAAVLTVLLVQQLSPKARTALAAAYLVAAAGFLAYCGYNDQRRIAEYRGLIEANRGGRGETINILYNGLVREIDYLRRTGRHEEARAVEAEAEALERRISR